MTSPLHSRTTGTAMLLTAAALCLTCGCAVQTKAINALSRALGAEQSMLFAGENDPVLAAQSLPTVLKVYEALLERSPDDRTLLLATSKAFCLYAFAFVQAPADRMPPAQSELQKAEQKRARLLYQRARDYALSALELAHPGFRTGILEGRSDSALTCVLPADTSSLYWAGVAWMGQLTVGKPGLGALLHLAKAAAMVRKVVDMNPSYDSGAAYEALIAFYAQAPKSMGGDTAMARQCFVKAVALAQGTRARPYVTFAQCAAARSADRAEYENLLGKALAVDTKERTRNRLMNLVFQDTARWLLAGIDKLFPAVPTPQTP